MAATGRRELRHIGALLLSIFGAAPASRKRRRRKRRSPRIGYRWWWNRQIPDPQERQVMAQIVAWKDAGWSWYEIARELLYRKAKTASGGDWNPSRIRRAYQAAWGPSSK
jgi:hypothetical protein